MPRINFGAIGLAFAMLSMPGAAAQQDATLGLLQEVLAAPAAVSYSGVVETVHLSGNTTKTVVYRVEHLAPNWTRRTYSLPLQLVGEEQIEKGNSTFTVDPKRRQIVVSRNDLAIEDRRRLGTDAALIRANYRAVRVRIGLYDGRPATDVLLVNKYNNRATMLVRIDRQTKIVLEKQEFATNGAVMSDIRLERVHYGGVPAHDFDLPGRYAVVPAAQLAESSSDVSRLVRDAGFTARRPTLPDGFVPQDGTIVSVRGVRTLHLLYSDGLRTLSLFESAAAMEPNLAPLHPQSLTVGDRNAQYAEDGVTALMTWSDGGLYYTLVGELDRGELQRLAAAIAVP